MRRYKSSINIQWTSSFWSINDVLGCPTISQVWDIQNYFYWWRFGGISDEIFIKIKEKFWKSTVRLTLQLYKENPEKNTKEKFEIRISTFLALKRLFKDIWHSWLHFWGASASFDTHIDIQRYCYVIVPNMSFWS